MSDDETEQERITKMVGSLANTITPKSVCGVCSRLNHILVRDHYDKRLPDYHEFRTVAAERTRTWKRIGHIKLALTSRDAARAIDRALAALTAWEAELQ